MDGNGGNVYSYAFDESRRGPDAAFVHNSQRGGKRPTEDSEMCVWGRLTAAATANVVELVDFDLSAQCVAVDAEALRGSRLVPIGEFESVLDELLFEFGDGFLEENAALDHHADEGLELIFHSDTLHECETYPPNQTLTSRAPTRRTQKTRTAV